jgi:hypothetical protein
VDEEKLAHFRKWMSEQQGFRALYHVEEPETGAALSISVWEC